MGLYDRTGGAVPLTSGVSDPAVRRDLKRLGGMVLPAGTIVDYAGSSAPDGWLICQGQAISNANTLYPELWAVAPSGWKSGTTLTLPNTKGKVTVGLDSADTAFDAIGETGGAKTHTLASGNIPTLSHSLSGSSAATTHTHADTFSVSISGGSHSHGVGAGTQFVQAGTPYLSTNYVEGAGGTAMKVGSVAYSTTTATSSSHSHTATVNGTVSSETAHVHGVGTLAVAAHGSASPTAITHLPPYIVFHKIIKAH